MDFLVKAFNRFGTVAIFVFALTPLLDQNAILDIGSAYHAAGNILKTPYGEIVLEPETYKNLYSRTLGTISHINDIARRRYASLEDRSIAR